MMWLLDEATARDMRRAFEFHGIGPKAQESFALVAQSQLENGAPPNLSIAGDVAEVGIAGVLTDAPDIMAFLFGGGNTTFAEIRSALAIAESDPAVSSIVLRVSSPGGTVDGLFETIEAIRALSKPVSVVASKALSAAFGLAAAAGNIQAVTPASEFGSLGVATSAVIDPNVVDIANTDSPDKRPDASTDAGRGTIRRHLDDVFDEFVRVIAEGRGISEDKVREDFGRGATLTARRAIERGMIDSIAQSADAKDSPGTARGATAPTGERIETMNEELLKMLGVSTEAAAAGRIAALLQLETQLCGAFNVESASEAFSQIGPLAEAAEKSADLAAKVAQFEAAAASRELDDKIASLSAAGKLPPSLHAWAKTQTVAQLDAWGAAAPVIASASVQPPTVATASVADLDETEKSLADQLGLNAADVAKAKAEARQGA